MKARKGDTVKVLYKGTLEDGTVFDASQEDAPLQFEVGSGQIIGGFEEAVLGMAKGEEKQFSVPPEEAYGPRREDLVGKLPREQLGEMEVEVGSVLKLETKDGDTFEASVQEVRDDGVVVDLNHPLAGQTLNFEVTLLELDRSAK